MKLTRQLLSIGFALLVSTVLASAIPGRAEVKKVIGSATVTKAAGGSATITEGMVLGTGDTITTGRASFVDLYLGLNGDFLRVDADTTLKLDVLDIANIAERTVTTQLSLGKGGITGNVVTKLTAASKYEIKSATGVAGIRGTTYQMRFDGTLIVASGRVNFTFVLNGVTKTVSVAANEQFKPGDAAPTPAPPAAVAMINQVAAIITQYAQLGVNLTGLVGVTVENPLTVSVAAP